MLGLGNRYKCLELGKGILFLRNKNQEKFLMNFKLGSDNVLIQVFIFCYGKEIYWSMVRMVVSER